MIKTKAMTPKEKAIELVNKFRDYTNGDDPNNDYRFSPAIEKENAKKCALIAVDEILEDRKEMDGMKVINDPYWLEVKQEIEKL
jgi:hypothetical protein